MKVHLIRSAELDKELFTSVVSLLQAVPGPIKFSFDADSIIDFDQDEIERKTFEDEEEFVTTTNYSLKVEKGSYFFPRNSGVTSWRTLFNKCNDYRRKNNVDSAEFVFLLTEIPNNKNWFASVDENNPLNGFIHATDWSFYIDCPEQFPIAYEVIALFLHYHTYSSLDEMKQNVHQKAIGCINDFCLNKKDIILKLRTADICRTCMMKIKTRLSQLMIRHALEIMESLRVKMLYSQNFRQESPLSKLLIDRNKKIFLPDFENIEIKLTPLEKALFLLFLKYPNGIYMSSLSEHRLELYEIYGAISNNGDFHEMKQRIDDLVNVLSDSASQKISKIKKAFENAIGEDLAKNYYIKGGNGEVKRIILDRTLVVLPNSISS